MRYQYNKNELF